MEPTPTPSAYHKRRSIPLERVLERPGLNSRFGATDTGDLAASISRIGLLFPPLLVQAEDKAPLSERRFFYYVVHGHRRVQAMRALGWRRGSFLVACGLTLSDQYVMNLAENARENLTPAEIADRCCAIVDAVPREGPPISTEELAQRIGYSGSHIRNLMRLRRALHPDLWTMMMRTGHQAPVGALLRVVSLPIGQQLEAWRPIGEAIAIPATGSQQDGKPPRAVSWKRRATRLVEEATERAEAPEFVRGVAWVVDQLVGRRA